MIRSPLMSESNMNIIFIVVFSTFAFYHLIHGAPKPTTAIDYDWEDPPKIKEVAEGPYYDQFDYNVTRNYTVIAGTPAELLCRVKLKPTDGNKTISWLRHSDLHLLTIGTHSYSRDKRFSAVHRFPGNDWVLRIQQTEINDTGIYQCQVGTTPPVGITFHLSVVEPITSIIGAPDIYINKGSNLNITCIIKNWPIMDNPQSPSENQQVIWVHGKKGINYDSPRGGVSVVTEKSNKFSSSSLLIINASKEDSGKYTCKPDLANQTSVHVHVLPGETPAAMKNDAKTKGTADTTSKPEITKEDNEASTAKLSILLFLVTFINAIP